MLTEWLPVEAFDLKPGQYVTRGPNSAGGDEYDYPTVAEVAVYDGQEWQSICEQLVLEIYCIDGQPISII